MTVPDSAAMDRALVRSYLAGLVVCGVTFGMALDHGDTVWAVIFAALLVSGLAIGWWMTCDRA